MRWALLALVACGPPTVFPEARWESAPPPPRPAPPPPRAAPNPHAPDLRVHPKAAKPSRYRAAFTEVACPTNLTLSVNRSIDGRPLATTVKGNYARQHRQLVKRDELLDPEVAIERVMALEAQSPLVVPAGFRDRIGASGRDAAFRLHMARCELADPMTTRRAGYDAAIAYLLGAPAADVRPVIEKSLWPDGAQAQTCERKSDCGRDQTCDPVARICTTVRWRPAQFLSQAELDIEDALVRAFGTKLTSEQLERPAPGDVTTMWLFGRYTKCDRELCEITRVDVAGKPRLVHRDHRDRGNGVARVFEPWEVCYAETRSRTRGGCLAHCEGDRGSKQRATCVATCAALCPMEAPRSPGPDDD